MAGLIEIAAFMDMYNMHGQHVADRSMTRYRHDNGKMIENNEISTGPGRWALGGPNAYGNAAFVPTATTINQKWGAAHDMTSTKTDVESDLKNLGRPRGQKFNLLHQGWIITSTRKIDQTPLLEMLSKLIGFGFGLQTKIRSKEYCAHWYDKAAR